MGARLLVERQTFRARYFLIGEFFGFEFFVFSLGRDHKMAGVVWNH